MPALSSREKAAIFPIDPSYRAISDLDSIPQGHVWRPMRGGNIRVRANTRFEPVETTVAWANATYTKLTFVSFACPVEEELIDHVDCNAYPLVVAAGYIGPAIELENAAILAIPTAAPGLEESEEEGPVEFRCLSPRVQSIAALRDKVKLTKAAADFVKGVRAHAFRIEEDVEEQSE